MVFMRAWNGCQTISRGDLKAFSFFQLTSTLCFFVVENRIAWEKKWKEKEVLYYYDITRLWCRAVSFVDSINFSKTTRGRPPYFLLALLFFWHLFYDRPTFFGFNKGRENEVFFFCYMEPLSKPLQAAADLDAARCRGDWTAIPELAKRYKKYHPDESGTALCTRYRILFPEQTCIIIVLELAACLEAEYLIRGGEEKTSNSQRKSIWSTSSNHSASKMVTPEEDLDSIHRHDDPDHIALAPRLNLASSQAILSSLQNLVQKQGNAQELQTTDDWQAQVRAFRPYLATLTWLMASESLVCKDNYCAYLLWIGQLQRSAWFVTKFGTPNGGCSFGIRHGAFGASQSHQRSYCC